MKYRQSSPFISLLTILFIGLKLTGYITWSWWWVLSPIWIGILVVLVIMVIVVALKVWAESR
jgi:hypothetical protein